MFKNAKMELQAKTLRRLQDENSKLKKENAELKKRLQENDAVVRAAEKYRDDHRKAMSLLAEARERYNEAISEVLKEKRIYKEEFEKLLEKMA